MTGWTDNLSSLASEITDATCSGNGKVELSALSIKPSKTTFERVARYVYLHRKNAHKVAFVLILAHLEYKR